MKLRRKHVWKILLAAAVLVLAGGIIAPRLDADRFGGRVKVSLQQALGREVEIGKVRLNVFSGPGFSVDRVIIHEDPSAGLEPFAYVETLTARVSFTSFWTGRLVFSNLRLDNASVNLARPDGGRWNFEYLLSRTAGAAVKGGMHLPEIQVRGSRINFRFGDTKSTFYLSDASMDVIPPGSPTGEWRAQFEGEAARTDRGSYGFGRFSARGRWKPASDGGRIEAFVELEKSSLSDLIRLAHGHDIGVHGQISSQARLVGPPSDITIEGRMQVGDIHRWDLLPPHGDGWPLNYAGKLDLASQVLEVKTVPRPGETLPISVEFRATDYLSNPRWAVLAKFDRLPLAPLPEVGRHMGVALPDALAMTGELSGAIGYSPSTGFQGTVASGETVVTNPGAPAVKFDSCEVRLDPAGMRLMPAIFEAAGQEAILEGVYTWQEQNLAATITGTRVQIPGKDDGAPGLLATVPVLENLTDGSWKGRLEYTKRGNAPGLWTGAFQVEDAVADVSGIAGPMRLASARVTLNDSGVVVDRMTGAAGPIEFKGDYRYVPGANRPDQIHLVILKASPSELERVLMPALHRDENLLARALRFGRSRVPNWLEARQADVTLEIGSVPVRSVRLEKLRCHLRWEGATVETSDLTAKFGTGTINGQFTANLRRSAPAYRFAARFRGLPWLGGKWDGRSVLQASGTGAELLRSLRLDGSFQAQSVSLASDAQAETLSGRYAFSMSRDLPVFRFTEIQMAVGETSFKGEGATGQDGRVYFDFSDGQKQMRIATTLSPFELEFLPPLSNPGAP